MSPIRRDDEEEPGGQLDDLPVDLSDRVCSRCRRELPPWARQCPDCGGDAVKRTALQSEDDPLLARFLEEEDEERGGEGDAEV